MPTLRNLFGPKPPPERRLTISGPIPDARYRPLHEAAENIGPYEAAKHVVEAYANVWPQTQAIAMHREPGLRRMATVDKSDDGLFVSWRRMPASKRPAYHKKNTSKGEELRVYALKNLAQLMRRRRWLSGELLQYDLPTGPQPEIPYQWASRPPLARSVSEPHFRLDLPPDQDYVDGYAL